MEIKVAASAIRPFMEVSQMVSCKGDELRDMTNTGPSFMGLSALRRFANPIIKCLSNPDDTSHDKDRQK